MNELPVRLLPADDPQRAQLHNEVHARPTARIRTPALVTYVALLNAGVDREAEHAHLRSLPGQQGLGLESLQGNFLRLRCEGYTLKWERHTEFTRYSIVQPLPGHAALGSSSPDLLGDLVVSDAWLQSLPGQVMAAIQLAMVHGELHDAEATMEQARHWLGAHSVVASVMGNNGHSWAVTDLRLRTDGFERMLVIASPGITDTRAGRISQRLLEIETYRLMALRGLPVAKEIGPLLAQAERDLAAIMARLEQKSGTDQELLDTLVALAARIERATAEHDFRFSATRAYDKLVSQRLTELREQPVSGTQTLGEFMQRRLSPAIATVMATEQRLASLSERVSRTSALLRTRVDIATEAQNQQLLEKLTRGQELQLKLQSTVEGLSIAAISYYVVSLLAYGAKALKAGGAHIDVEVTTGLLIPLVLWAVWRTTRRIHARLHGAH